MVKIKDVAKVAGVSTATVSRALANKPNVRAEVKQHVLNVAEKLNTNPTGPRKIYDQTHQKLLH